MLPECLIYICVDVNPDYIVRLDNEPRFIVNPIIKLGLILGVELVEGVEDYYSDKVVPEGHTEVVVEEDDGD